MKTVNVIVGNVGINLDAYVECAAIFTTGDTLDEIKSNMREAISLYLEGNDNPCQELRGEYELNFVLDADSFFKCKSKAFTSEQIGRLAGLSKKQFKSVCRIVQKNGIRECRRLLRTK